MMDVAAMQAAFAFLYQKVRIQTKPFHVHAFISSSHRTYGTIPGWCVLNHRCSNTARAYIGPLIGRSQLDSRLPLPGPLCLPR